MKLFLTITLILTSLFSQLHADTTSPAKIKELNYSASNDILFFRTEG